ncbi:MAG: hypothetical protein JXB48_12500 [Candidatus Latescibacteria bacterium]|nr:hypothetical protein [Candidatus Latescibacterota bacterium]
MVQFSSKSGHTFHIPVMGTGFTIDTPLKVAKFGISSVISLVDDLLIEQMRKFHCQRIGEPYNEITEKDDDYRANRITAYLNFIDSQVKKQVRNLRNSPFENGSEISQYYEMLPETGLKKLYYEMLDTKEIDKKLHIQEELRDHVVPGSIDVNIMTKLDRDIYRNGVKQPPEFSDALSALRGFAQSTLDASIICSAGFNRRFYSYFAQFKDFYPDVDNYIKKKIILKVSDFRSAVIQGKFLAQRGLWVSEFRIESGLNCGGHAFATNGFLVGPILEEFKQRKLELTEMLHSIYYKSISASGLTSVDTPREMRITMQGGIGTAAENDLLHKHYNLDATGWGTPFMLAPDVVNIDDAHLEKLIAAGEKDVFLSDSSPLGISFWNLRNSASEENRRANIHKGKPGSRCIKGYLVSDTEFTELPICRASSAYQKLKLNTLQGEELSNEQTMYLKTKVLEKSCICHDLAGSATLKNGIDTDAKPSICCGPNIVNFSKVTSLQELVDHIYGRISLLTNADRPHFFIRELMIYIDYLRNELEKFMMGVSDRNVEYFTEFKNNLLKGIDYYCDAAEKFFSDKKNQCVDQLMKLKEDIEQLCVQQPFELCIEQ